MDEIDARIKAAPDEELELEANGINPKIWPDHPVLRELISRRKAKEREANSLARDANLLAREALRIAKQDKTIAITAIIISIIAIIVPIIVSLIK